MRAGQKLGGWTLKKEIGRGGNGVVWRASKKGSSDRAIKVLREQKTRALDRFKAEIDALLLIKELPGIIPIMEYELSQNSRAAFCWYSMPLATQFAEFVSEKKHIEIIKEFVLLAQTLAELHSNEIFHRDIKPANLLSRGDRLCFSDFGLVKFPDRQDITRLQQDVGPKFTMAPEMRRTASEAEGGPADVYSFCKTIWIALTNQPLAFDGQYIPDTSLGLKNYCDDLYLTKLDTIIMEATDNDASNRPDIKDVISRLSEWVSLAENFESRNLTEWREAQEKLFPYAFPKSATWTDLDSICSVLQLVSQVSGLNHMFVPRGGGVTIKGASKATELGLIELKHSFTTLLKPVKLTYESFGLAAEWNYFRLEAASLSPTGIEGAHLCQSGYAEELCEISPGNYAGYDLWLNGTDGHSSLPREARPVIRYLKGTFVIFSTRSPYNLDTSTYDARHTQMIEDQFRSYIRENAEK